MTSTTWPCHAPQPIAEHLIELGQRRIASIGTVTSQQSHVDRRGGYRDAMTGAGLALDADLELKGGFSVLGAYREVRRAVACGLQFSARMTK